MPVSERSDTVGTLGSNPSVQRASEAGLRPVRLQEGGYESEDPRREPQRSASAARS